MQIYPNSISIDEPSIEEKGGILNTLTFASAQYIYKVLERHNRNQIKWFDQSKAKKLRRTIIHKNSHLDEYFAELLFRAILPLHLKDIEVSEHVLISKDNDSYARLSWPNGVVFGIGADEAGGAKSLATFDEHQVDGTRLKPSCSQLIADEFIGANIPYSIKKVLGEVNYTDSHGGAAHQYHIKNLFFAMHDIMFAVGRDEIDGRLITKYLTENWKRAIFDSCIVSVIYAFENDHLKNEIDENTKIKLEKHTKKSLDKFLENTLLRENEYFERVSKDLLYKFRVGNHELFDKTIWLNEQKQIIGRQYLVLPFICFALEKCWGEKIADFVMMHIWQMLFQQQLSFQEIKSEILAAQDEVMTQTKFGSIRKILLKEISFIPLQAENDRRRRTLKLDSPLWVYEASVTNPNYPNVRTVLVSIINDDYGNKGNNGFALIFLHDKTINAKMINNGQTVPYNIWKQISDTISVAEPEAWFQLKDEEGKYAVFIMNRTKAHQDILPSSLITIDFLIETIKGVGK